MIVVKEPGVVAGVEVAHLTFREQDPSLHFDTLVPDGTLVEPARAGSVMSDFRSSLRRGSATLGA